MNINYTFDRYLSSKKTVDDRALNQHVWQTMMKHLPAATADNPLRVLELGAGIGTMVERLVEHNVLTYAHYTALDAEASNIEVAKQRLNALPDTIHLELEAIDCFDFVVREQTQPQWDVLIAHAFLDLLHLPTALPQLLSLLRANGYFYFTINFDGATILQPPIDSAFDAQVETLYHRTMDERITAGKPSGDSQTGRHLFQQLPQAGATILAAGSSDWVVFASQEGKRYPADEGYFLHYIINTMAGALRGHPELDEARFSKWIATRHAQIDAGELVYIAHQLDFFGRVSELVA